jgi:hypothetical protein
MNTYYGQNGAQFQVLVQGCLDPKSIVDPTSEGTY